jgi:L-threonylcarbamoyladenylate synthase
MLIGQTNAVVRVSPQVVALPSQPQEYARHLYSVLRQMDAMGLDAIYVQMPPDQPRWAAVRDRLRRATRPVV